MRNNFAAAGSVDAARSVPEILWAMVCVAPDEDLPRGFNELVGELVLGATCLANIGSLLAGENVSLSLPQRIAGLHEVGDFLRVLPGELVHRPGRNGRFLERAHLLCLVPAPGLLQFANEFVPRGRELLTRKAVQPV